MNLSIKPIAIIIFTLTLFTNKCFTKNFYVKNKSNSSVIVEAIYSKKNKEFRLVNPNKKISIRSKSYMPIYGEYRGIRIDKEIESINIYACKISYDSFGYKIIIPAKKIISIENNLETPLIKYHHEKYGDPIYSSHPLSISYEE